MRFPEVRKVLTCILFVNYASRHGQAARSASAHPSKIIERPDLRDLRALMPAQN